MKQRNELYLDKEYYTDCTSKFNYVSIIKNPSEYIKTSNNGGDIDDVTDSDGIPNISICINAPHSQDAHRYANDGSNIYHPVRRIGKNWFKLIQANTDLPEITKNLENN